MQKMLTQCDMTLSEAQSDIKDLFGADYENDIWAMLCQINDLDPSEFEERQGVLVKEVENKLAISKDAESSKIIEKGQMVLDTEQRDHKQEQLVQWMESSYGGIVNFPVSQIFSIRCFVGTKHFPLSGTFITLTCIAAWLRT